MKHTFFYWVAVGSFLFTTSCTSVLMPNEQQVTIKTTNTESKVYSNNKEIATGENTQMNIQKRGEQILIVKTPGYKDEHILLKPYKRSPLFYPLALLDILMYPAKNRDIVHEPSTFLYESELNLENDTKLPAKTDEEKGLMLESIEVAINNLEKDIQTIYVVDYSGDDMVDHCEKLLQDKIKREEDALKKMKKKEKQRLQQNTLKKDDKSINGVSEQLSEKFHEVLLQSGYVDTINKVFRDNYNTIWIQGRLKNANEFVIADNTVYRYVSTNIDWIIYNNYDEKLDSIRVYSYSDPFEVNLYYDGSASEVLDNCFTNSYLKLRENEKFAGFLKINATSAIPSIKTTIKTPTQKVTSVEDAASASVIIKRKDKGHGSGFAITNDGYILTNFHVVAGKSMDELEKISVILANGDEIDAEVISYNREKDLALLKANTKFEKAFVLKNTKEYKVLQEVYTIGAPKSIELGQTVSIGLLSSERKNKNVNILQLSINLNSGNSGGPLFDKTGALHGVIRSKLIGKNTEGVGFAIPSFEVGEALNINVIK